MIVISLKFSRKSKAFQITHRIGGNAIPPAINKRFFPFHSFKGNVLPKGPRKPTVAPASNLDKPVVTLPACRKVHSIYPLRVGEEAIQKVDSPSPNAEYSPNCPASKWKFSPSCSSLISDGMSSLRALHLLFFQLPSDMEDKWILSVYP